MGPFVVIFFGFFGPFVVIFFGFFAPILILIGWVAMSYYDINNNFGYNVMGRISISQWINLNGDPMERQLRLNVIGRIS